MDAKFKYILFFAFVLIFLTGFWIYYSRISVSTVEALTSVEFPEGSYVSYYRKIGSGINSAFIVEVSIPSSEDVDNFCDRNSFSRDAKPPLDTYVAEYLIKRKYSEKFICYRQSYDTSEYWYSVVLGKRVILFYSTS